MKVIFSVLLPAGNGISQVGPPMLLAHVTLCPRAIIWPSFMNVGSAMPCTGKSTPFFFCKFCCQQLISSSYKTVMAIRLFKIHVVPTIIKSGE
jgi:hypothetical protein